MKYPVVNTCSATAGKVALAKSSSLFRFPHPPRRMNALPITHDANRLGALIEQLADENPVARQRAREELVRLDGHEVTRALVAELIDPRAHVRWEAAKTLAVIADPIAAHGLTHALDDEDRDVRWVAAEGLIVLGKTGLMTVLSGLTKRAQSTAFCQSAHHVLREMGSRGYADVVAPVLGALEGSEPGVGAPPAAYCALVALKHGAKS
jgi:hypothetical protein